ncbi:MAG: hypothetical protein ACYC2R_09200 [Burkholderiales bacterium]
MEKLEKSDKINLWVGKRSAADLALKKIVESNPRTSEALKHRILLGELALRGIAATEPTNPQSVALQILTTK